MPSIEEQRKAFLDKKLKDMANIGVNKERRSLGFDPIDEEEVPIEDEQEVEPQKEQTSVKTKPIKHMKKQAEDYEAYREQFFAPQSFKQRSSFMLNRETLQLLRYVLFDLGEEISLTAYIENILRGHLSEHRDLLNETAAKRRRKITIPQWKISSYIL